MAPAPKSIIYFIQSGGPGGHIKIGLARSLKGRLSNLQTSTPHELTVLKTVRGDRRTERRFHSQFAHLHHRGEWFHPGEDLMAFIDAAPVEEPAAVERGADDPFLWLGDFLERRMLERPDEYLAEMGKDTRGPRNQWLQHAAWVRRAAEKHGKPIPEAVKQFLSTVC